MTPGDQRAMDDDLIFLSPFFSFCSCPRFCAWWPFVHPIFVSDGTNILPGTPMESHLHLVLTYSLFSPFVSLAPLSIFLSWQTCSFPPFLYLSFLFSCNLPVDLLTPMDPSSIDSSSIPSRCSCSSDFCLLPSSSLSSCFVLLFPNRSPPTPTTSISISISHSLYFSLISTSVLFPFPHPSPALVVSCLVLLHLSSSIPSPATDKNRVWDDKQIITNIFRINRSPSYSFSFPSQS